MTLFPNVRPQANALAIIDAERHPIVYKYAQVNTEAGHSVAERREQLWMEGYRRYGDEMEAVLQRSSKNIKNARVWHRSLEAKLEDPWMLVGLTVGIMDPQLSYAWKTFQYGDGSQSSAAASVARLFINYGNPPARYEEFIDWIRELYEDGVPLDGLTWHHAADRFFRGWTYPEILRVMDTGITAEEARRTRLKTVSHMLLYMDGIPLEYVLEME